MRHQAAVRQFADKTASRRVARNIECAAGIAAYDTCIVDQSRDRTETADRHALAPMTRDCAGEMKDAEIADHGSAYKLDEQSSMTKIPVRRGNDCQIADGVAESFEAAGKILGNG